jgi:uncharacterized protein (DUF302 family)
MKLIKFYLLIALLIAAPVRAENMIMQRVHHNFETTMILVKEKLNEYGYKVAHIQKCDGGLSDFGYKTDEYRSIFYGKFEEIRYLTGKYPLIIPYVPLKIAVMKEKDTVVIVAINPYMFSDFFPEKELAIQFGRWENDIRAIFEEVAQTPLL